MPFSPIPGATDHKTTAMDVRVTVATIHGNSLGGIIFVPRNMLEQYGWSIGDRVEVAAGTGPDAGILRLTKTIKNRGARKICQPPGRSKSARISIPHRYLRDGKLPTTPCRSWSEGPHLFISLAELPQSAAQAEAE